ncbi:MULTISPECIES: enoyl-CoA hydratase/isomerase family protein [Legionella]|uniref:Enoyl-CoA hydratase n=1 Tax=Legionella septentrionalis TaxID=2498109 RepID=A0A3S0V9L4_9GAMM|nr:MULTISPECIES: enoyl-CoA hydratase-related protein [Legionella]MCP0914677.1 enoyl-CoA hydratase-related protein [Legionella sp. 27cVA30]RUQ81607.1 enoyl-CoA hydratase [Legionella septentrionalis]RUQ95747.1 enoyl-CoA hydratase [Legionella septentrionalis]RUR09139.1 enoyl-CoA hydratase [Legionella septentrionalis]RUR15646.1 enoyl-CoA hydratase [Legionella septentrionalis]
MTLVNLIEQELDNDGILTLTLNRPDKLNALSTEVLMKLGEAFSSAKANPMVKALLLTGKGKAFCAGADIARLAECDAQSGYEFACFGQDVFRQLETLGKPSLAAVNGYAFGGGCELAMAATLRTAAATAQFGQPEVKLGVIPGYGGTQRLGRLVGKGRALDLCLTGRFIDAETALQWGLVNAVVPAETLLEESRRMLKTILTMAPLAISSVLEVIDKGYDMALPDALHLEAVHFAKVCASKDKVEGVAAFLEKRPAQFKGI